MEQVIYKEAGISLCRSLVVLKPSPGTKASCLDTLDTPKPGRRLLSSFLIWDSNVSPLSHSWNRYPTALCTLASSLNYNRRRGWTNSTWQQIKTLSDGKKDAYSNEDYPILPPVDQFLIMPLRLTWILWRPDAFHQGELTESKRKDHQGQKHQKSRQRLYNETKVQYIT